MSAFGLVCWAPGPLERGAHRAGAGKNRLFFQQAVLSAFGLARAPRERRSPGGSREEPSVFSAGCLVSFWVGLLGARAPRERRSPGGSREEPSVFSAGCLVSFWVGLLGARPLERGAHRAGAGKNRLFFQQAVLSAEQRTGPALHHGPSTQRGRRSAGSSGPCGRRSGRARGGAGLRSQLPQDAAEYVRLNVMPRPGPQPQPPPQIIGRPDDVERLLDEAGQRAQEVERGAAQAIEETAAVAAEEGEVAVGRRVGGAFGYLGGLAEGAAALAPTTREVAGAMAATAGVGAAATAGLAVGLAGGAAYGLARGTGWVLENTLFRPQQGSEDAAVQDVRSANNMNDATQPQHFTLRTGSSTSGSPASSRASSQSGFRVQAQTNHTPRLNPVTLPQSQPNSRASLPQLGAVAPEPPASAELRPAGPRYRGGLDSPSPYERK